MRIDKNKVEIKMAEKCMTYNTLAKEMEVNHATLSKYLNVKVKNNKPYVVGKIAKALDCAVTDIIVQES